MPEALSTGERRVLEYLVRRAEPLPPTVREICSELSIRSTSTVHRYLSGLRAKGLISMDSANKRTIRVLGQEATVSVPLVGAVAAGAPLLAVEEIEEYIPLAYSGADAGELFALRVEGESMIGDGILDGDVVVARRVPTVDAGELAVVLVEDGATVKRFYPENGHFRLQPSNPAYAPILVPEATVLGRLVAVLRRY